MYTQKATLYIIKRDCAAFKKYFCRVLYDIDFL